MCWRGWLKGSEPIALWLEGIALVLIFIYDCKDSKRERKEAHADCVAAIYEKLREFLLVTDPREPHQDSAVASQNYDARRGVVFESQYLGPLIAAICRTEQSDGRNWAASSD
jgi:hypothetical protein